VNGKEASQTLFLKTIFSIPTLNPSKSKKSLGVTAPLCKIIRDNAYKSLFPTPHWTRPDEVFKA
jgi:hypothetical protein